MADYHLWTRYRFVVPIHRIWATLVTLDRNPEWLRGVFDTTQLEEGDAEGAGSVAYYSVRGRLPLRIHFVAMVTRVDPPHRMELRADGDLQGTGCWTLAQEGRVAEVAYTWDVRTTQRWMNILEPIARPVFEWNHHAVMTELGRRLARHLEVPLVDVVAGAAAGAVRR